MTNYVVIGVSAAAGAIGSFAGSLTESAVLGEDFSDGDVWLNVGVDALWGMLLEH